MKGLVLVFVLGAGPLFAQQPPPVTPPSMIATAVDLSGVYLRLDAETGQLEQIAVNLRGLAQNDVTEIALLQQIQARLIQHDEEPMFLTKVLSSRAVQTILAVVGGLLVGLKK